MSTETKSDSSKRPFYEEYTFESVGNAYSLGEPIDGVKTNLIVHFVRIGRIVHYQIEDVVIPEKVDKICFVSEKKLPEEWCPAKAHPCVGWARQYSKICINTDGVINIVVSNTQPNGTGNGTYFVKPFLNGKALGKEIIPVTEKDHSDDTRETNP